MVLCCSLSMVLYVLEVFLYCKDVDVTDVINQVEELSNNI